MNLFLALLVVFGAGGLTMLALLWTCVVAPLRAQRRALLSERDRLRKNAARLAAWQVERASPTRSLPDRFNTMKA